MGDRGNIQVKDDYTKGDGVFLYSHWGGSELPYHLAEALDSPEGRGRWNDRAYLARIIFDYMKRNSPNVETGYGIDTVECDPNHPTLVVDCTNKTVDDIPFEEFITSRKRSL
jgi:hypothetical protein